MMTNPCALKFWKQIISNFKEDIITCCIVRVLQPDFENWTKHKIENMVQKLKEH